ncbi:MAG: glycoside hydrolase family 18 protein [Bacteroidales bacterium]|nr:glycoside hydrolase family 18 protein [Bacteroidales bacterium]
MNRLSVFIMAFTIALAYSCGTGNEKESKLQVENYFSVDSSEIAIMAYYMARNNYDPSEIPVGKLTHIIFSFTEVIDNKMEFRGPESGQRLKELVLQKQRNPGLKVMVACGGWGGSGGFSDMAASAENRHLFVQSVIDFINEYNLDGLDIDWEYPGLPGIGNPFRPEDRENFTSLMKELREAMDATGKKLTLTFAAAGWDKFFENIETLEVMKYADYMNLMTYDFVGGHQPYTAHHTNLGLVSLADLEGTDYLEYINDSIISKEQTDWQPRSIEGIIDFCTGLGVDRQQLIIGAAFYGKAWKVETRENNGLYQATRGPQSGWPSYAAIRDSMENKNGYTVYRDEKARAPYIFNESDSLFITFDDTLSVRLKARYAMDNKLGGIMFWEQSQDTKDGKGLLDAIFSVAGNR